MRTEKLKPYHMKAIMPFLQDRQYDFSKMSHELIDTVEDHGPGIAVFEGDSILGCLGIIDLPGTHRAIVWAVFAAVIKEDAIGFFRAGMKFLAQNPRRRMEIHIDPDFPASIRLAKMIGFEYEGLMRGFTETGADRQLWAKV